MRMIVAVDQDNAIGWSDGRIPWRSPQDMARFKEITFGGSVLMGRKTWDSLPVKFKPLPNRINHVMTRDVDAACELMRNKAVPVMSGFEAPLSKGIWLIGGAQLYNAALDQGLVTELYITQVHMKSGADVRLAHDLYSWKLFAVNELTRLRAWRLEDIQVPTVPATDPGITFLKFVRIQ